MKVHYNLEFDLITVDTISEGCELKSNQELHNSLVDFIRNEVTMCGNIMTNVKGYTLALTTENKDFRKVASEVIDKYCEKQECVNCMFASYLTCNPDMMNDDGLLKFIKKILE